MIDEMTIQKKTWPPQIPQMTTKNDKRPAITWRLFRGPVIPFGQLRTIAKSRQATKRQCPRRPAPWRIGSKRRVHVGDSCHSWECGGDKAEKVTLGHAAFLVEFWSGSFSIRPSDGGLSVRGPLSSRASFF